MGAFVCRQRAVWFTLSLAVLACSFTQSLSASAVVVGTCKNLVQFTTIQAAINAVPASSTVNICPGVYAEQISINKSITLIGVAFGTSDAAVIVPPAGGLSSNATSLATSNAIAAHIWVLGPATVNLTNLVVDSLGNGLSGCGPPTLVGILYQNASGIVNHVATRNQWIGSSETDTGSNGCQNGLGIFVQSGGGGTSLVNVLASSVHDYQKNGITGNEAGTTLNVSNSDIVGQGATNGAAENGIQLGFGAAGTLTGNLVIDHVWAPDTISDPGDAAAGILLFDASSGHATVKSNTVGNAQYGIAIVSDTSGQGDTATVTMNKVFGTRIFDGIDACSNGNIIQSNTIMNSSESAIHLDVSCSATGNGNSVTSNTMIDACTGVLVDSGTSGNVITPNTFFATGLTSGSSCTPAPSHQQGAQKKSKPQRGTYHSPVRP